MKLLNNIEMCIMPALEKNVDETEHHKEYESRHEKLEKYFAQFLKDLSDSNLRTNEENSASVLSSIYILYKDLLARGPWHSESLLEYAQKLDLQCQLLHNIELKCLLKSSHVFNNNQSIFDECMHKLHGKLTSTDFKKYPSLVEVYCSMMEEIQDYVEVTVNLKAFPTSLYLIEDFNNTYRRKGLQCCINILKYLKPKAFTEGNYYEVIMTVLKKRLVERDIEITKLVTECFKELLKALPDDGYKIYASQELYGDTLTQIQTESNLYRKAALLNFTTYLIQTIGVNAVNKRAFNSTVCDCLEHCCVDGVGEILLDPVLECLEEWIVHCWCVWKFVAGQKMMTTLIKILVITTDTMIIERLVKLIATLICLSTEDNKTLILKNLKDLNTCNGKFKEKVDLIIKYANV